MSSFLSHEPAFVRPWHAQLFAMTVRLSEQGLFTWEELTRSLGSALEVETANSKSDECDRYYLAWLTALETILMKRQLIHAREITTLADAWRVAYQNTPHGHPVTLDQGAM